GEGRGAARGREGGGGGGGGGGVRSSPPRRDRYPECRPRIKRIWPAHHQLDLPCADETERRVVEHIRAIPVRRGEGRLCAKVGLQRLQTQLDLRGIPHGGAPMVAQGNDHAV